MESLSETTWDVIICGTGLQQSLLALALSRSDKKILHVDPNGYYGGAEAAFSLQEADAWAQEVTHKAASPSSSSSALSSIFSAAAVTRPSPPDADDDNTHNNNNNNRLSFPRAYALALAPQLVHARSQLLSQLVSSRAFRQLEFLAVGAFFVYKPATAALARIPSTREDVFSSADLSARAKRQLMKFLKLVLSYQDEASRAQWHEYAGRPLAAFLADKMGLADDELRTYVTTLTLSLDGGDVTTEEGLETIHRHLTSMGVFGPGFAALYPKWGGGSEIAQVGCRAGAVGGAIYMLGTGIKKETTNYRSQGEGEGDDLVELVLTDDTVVKTKLLVRGTEEVSDGDDNSHALMKVSKLIAILDTPLAHLFEPTVEGCPVPAVTVIAFPPDSVKTADAAASTNTHPIFVIVHSSDTGECPAGQSTLYFHTLHTLDSKALLESAVTALLQSFASTTTTTTTTTEDGEESPPATTTAVPSCLYQLYYEQTATRAKTAAAAVSSPRSPRRYFDFPTPSVSLTFDDATLAPVQQAWEQIVGPPPEDEDVQFMVFADREGVGDEDDLE